MAYRTAVLGASGYTGAELLRLLHGHPELEVMYVTAETNAGALVAELYPSLGAAYPGLTYGSLDLDKSDLGTPDLGVIDGVDVVFLALPHGQSQRLVPALVERVAHVVDLGADFRLPASEYERWYGVAHEAPAVLADFAYGLPEVGRKQLAASQHVAAPGCYPTAATLALAPMLAAGVIEATGVVVDALSGVSGRGRGLSAPSLYAEANENATAYGLLNHRHTGEIEHACTQVSGHAVQVLFTPHLVPMTRGILATCYARPATSGLGTERLLDMAREYYADEPFITVLDESPSTKATLGSNACHTTIRYDDRTGTVLAIAAIDNLVKGASGQAIQALNAVLGLPETTGLPVLGIAP